MYNSKVEEDRKRAEIVRFRESFPYGLYEAPDKELICEGCSCVLEESCPSLPSPFSTQVRFFVCPRCNAGYIDLSLTGKQEELERIECKEDGFSTVIL